MGLHGKIKRKQHISEIKIKEGKASAKVDANTPSHHADAQTKIDVKARIKNQEGKASAKTDANAPSQQAIEGMAKATNDVHAPSLKVNTPIDNHHKAMLLSLSTPGGSDTYQFDTDAERICIDTGASACISTKKESFKSLKPMSNIKINGIASGLQVAGIGLLKWSIRDDDNNEINLYIRDALYVPQAPMGLLCPQQIAQQTQKLGDGFKALRTYGIFTFNGFSRTVNYDTRSRLAILYTIGGVSAYTAEVNTTSAPPVPNLSAAQQLLLRWHNRLSITHEFWASARTGTARQAAKGNSRLRPPNLPQLSVW
jgi:hypothetical protein